MDLNFDLENMQQKQEHLAHLVISALMMRRGAKSRFGTAIDRPTSRPRLSLRGSRGLWPKPKLDQYARIPRMVRRLSHLVEITACDDPNGVVGVALKFILVCQHGSLEPTVPVEGLDLREKSRLKGFLMHARRYSKWTRRPST